MFNPFLSDVEVEPHNVPPYVNTSAESSMASNPFLTGASPFSYESHDPAPSQGENPFLSSMSNTVPAQSYGMGNPFADFVSPQPPAATVGYMSATETGINSWNDMQTSYGSMSELEHQPVSTSTQDLLFTVTGALEATSDSLLDRLRYTQPSPIPLPPSPTPSPRTPSPDLLMGDEDLQPMHPYLQPSIPKAAENTSTIDLMGLYNRPAEPKPNVTEAVSQPYAPDFHQTVPVFADYPPAQKQGALNDIMDIALDTTLADIAPLSPETEPVEIEPEVIEPIKPVEVLEPKVATPTPTPDKLPPARPAQPPKAMPSRPPPPVPPSPRKEPPVPSQPSRPAEVVQSFNLPKEEPYIVAPAAVEPPPTFTTSMYEQNAPTFTAPVSAPPTIFAAPPPVIPPAVSIIKEATSPFFAGDNFTPETARGRGAPPPPPSPRVFPSSPQPPPQKADFESFEDRFNSVPPEGDAFGTEASAFGGFDDTTTISTSSAWGDGGGSQGFGDSGSGFGNENRFDEFLSLREPPPVPQSTPAKSRLNSGNDEFDNADTRMTITIRQKEKLDFNLDLVPPTLAPPPKSPAISTGSVYSEENGSNFVPFLSSVKVITGEGGVQIPRSDSQDSPQTPLFEEDQSVPLEDFPRIKFSGDGWEMQMRHPNKKKITGQRFWKKVYVRLTPVNDIQTVQIFNSSKDKDPIQEIPLQPCYSVSDIAAQQFDQFGKIFTVKLQYIFYKERPGVRPGQITKAERITTKLSQFAAYAIQGDYQGVKEFGSDLKKLGLPLEHAPQVSQLVKLGTQNFEEMKHFSTIIEEALFRLPVHRDRALTYKSEEVQVTLVDEYYVEQDVLGVVTRQIARVRLYFLSFLSGAAEVELGINDIRRQGKEVVGRHDIIPIATEEWIRIEDIEFSSCVQLDVFEDTKMVKFKPPDACYIELLRFRVRPPRHRELPLQVKTVFTTTGHRIEIRSDILVPGFTSRKLGQIACEDVMIRIPIPECWIYMFRVEKHFRYGSVKSAHRRSGKVKGIERFLGAVEAVENSLMEVTSGQAKYEHQHKSIVWRVARLPKEGQGAYTTHSFFCHITLQPHEEIPANLTKHCYVEFTMPHTTISHTVCRSVSVPMCDEPPEKCVKYLSRHEYVVEIDHTQGVAPATYSLAATVVKEAPEEVKAEIPMEGKAQSDSDFSDDD